VIKSPISQLQEIAPSKRTIKGHLRRIERISLRHAHKFIIQRLANLREVRRHALGWLALVLLLSALALWQTNVSAAQYTTEVPAKGGVYTEGVYGTVDNLNPIFAATPAERSASRLLFANLLTYDQNGDLVGELAQHWQMDNTGKVFTLVLKSNAVWSDGAPLTAQDVLFTFNLIKNADTRSPLYASWRNVSVDKIDDATVRFTLPTAYAAFANSLVLGILPEHALRNVQPSELRTEPFDRAPTVTSGPFTFQAMNAVDAAQTHYVVRMAANKMYVLGAPQLDGFQLHAYKDRDDLTKALRSQEVAAISDPTLAQIKSIDTQRFTMTNSPLDNGVYAFLKTDSDMLSDVHVRQALQMATNYSAITKLFANTVQPLEGPLLPGQLGYKADIKPPAFDLAKANQLLDAAGWTRDKTGHRTKNGVPLKLRIVSISTGNYPTVTQEVMDEWSKIGVQFDASSSLVKADDVQQNVIAPRAYDVLIYEIAIGSDPDVYAYWHSSQTTENGFNLSDYKSPKVDDELDTARAKLDPALREAKYHLFTQQWLTDAPAVGLYRPSLTYVQNKDVTTFNAHNLVDPADRYFDVRYWAAGQATLRPTR